MNNPGSRIQETLSYCLIFKNVETFESLSHAVIPDSSTSTVLFSFQESSSSTTPTSLTDLCIDDVFIYTDMLPLPLGSSALFTTAIISFKHKPIFKPLCHFERVTKENSQIGIRWMNSIPLPPVSVRIKTVQVREQCGCILSGLKLRKSYYFLFNKS